MHWALNPRVPSDKMSYNTVWINAPPIAHYELFSKKTKNNKEKAWLIWYFMLILCMLKDLYLSYIQSSLTYNIQHFSYISQALSSLFSFFLIFQGRKLIWAMAMGPWAALVCPELIMSYKYLTYLVERRNSPVKLPYILYKPCYTISDGTHLHGPNRRDLAEK